MGVENEFVEEELTVQELKELYESGSYDIEIDSPDGWQEITRWVNKGPMHMFEIILDGLGTKCSYNHMLQLVSGEWKIAAEIEEGDILCTNEGDKVVISVNDLGYEEECYDFTVDHPNHRYYGDGIVSHNTGKSFFASGSVVRNCQEMGIIPILIDTENALDEEWLQSLGVDTSPEKLMKFNLAKVNDMATVVNEFITWYKSEYDKVDPADKPSFMFILDSLGMTITDNEEKQFTQGDMKGDMGLKAKQLNSFIRNSVHMISEHNIGIIATNHTYASQDMFSPEDKVSGGRVLEYGSSILVAMQKKKEKDGGRVTGINSRCKVLKSRYGKPFIVADVIIDFEKGVNPYSGLIDFFVEIGVLTQGGAYVTYITKNGEELKDYKSKFKNEWLDIVIDEFDYEKYSLKSKQLAEKQLAEEIDSIEETEDDY